MSRLKPPCEKQNDDDNQDDAEDADAAMIARLMLQAGLAGVSRRRFVTTTVRDGGRQAPDLVERNFTAEAPDRLWVADITYIPTWAGFLYLAVVLDAYSRRIVGWSMATTLAKQLVLGQREQGRDAEAEPLFRRALAIHEKVLGPDHPTVAANLNNLGAVYFSEGRYGEAEPLFRRALDIQERALGHDHPDVAKTLNNLAGSDIVAQHYDEASSLLEQALSILEKSVGPDHPDIAQIRSSLAMIQLSQMFKQGMDSLNPHSPGTPSAPAPTMDDLKKLLGPQGLGKD